jgi:hypothetical protein
MGEAGLLHLKRSVHVEDGAAMLNGDHAPRGETLAVADPLDVTEDRH